MLAVYNFRAQGALMITSRRRSRSWLALLFGLTLVSAPVAAMACGNDGQPRGHRHQRDDGYGRNNDDNENSDWLWRRNERNRSLAKACVQKVKLQGELEQLWASRQNLAAGRMGNASIENMERGKEADIWAHAKNAADAAAQIEAMHRGAESQRRYYLDLMDERISQIQDRLGQLEYECPD